MSSTNNNNSDLGDVVLEVDNLKTYFKTPHGLARAVDGVSFQIRQGETFAIVGESGCGKTVTALSIIQLLARPPAEIAGGSVLYKGENLLRIPEMRFREYRGNEISMIFQEPMTSLNPVFTVGNQLLETITLHQGLQGNDARDRAIQMLERVGIPAPAQRFGEYPHQLSGGMRQRVMIAMALACRPGLLIADEPTTALDVTVQAQILDLMRELQTRYGTAILLITHNMGVVAENAHRIGIMYAGRIVEIADRQRIFENPGHPYTVRLLQSLPSGEKRDRSLQTIEGRVPRATEFPDGCRFAPRCHKRIDTCTQVDPTLIDLEAGHRAACILYDPTVVEAAASTSDMDPEVKHRAPAKEVLTEEPPLLEVRGLEVHFPIKKGVFQQTVGHVRAVDGVDLSIRRGRTLGLVGESGCGKTTLGKALLQLIPPTGGSVTLDGVSIGSLSRTQMRPYRQRMQIIFQDPFSSLNPRMIVEEILAEGMKVHRVGESAAERRELIAETLERVGLDPRMMNRYPHEFSGGQRQRIGIARCLAVNPEFIVCDEATSALDVSVQAQILNLLDHLQSELDLTYLFITHDLSVVEYLADEVAVMYLGRIVERGPTQSLFANPQHPYTKALLSAVPRIDPESGVGKIRLTGDVPSPINPPRGCHFHPRCSAVMPRCSMAYPPPYQTGQHHTTGCFLYDPVAEETADP